MATRYIPEATKRRLLEETQFRCAYCLSSLEHAFDDSTFFDFSEKAHLTPHSQTGDNSFENLICLCPNCHKKFDKNPDKDKSVLRLKALKSSWFVASGQYSKLELDCLFDLFYKNQRPWIETKQFFNNQSPKFSALCFAVPIRQAYLFQNLIKNKLVDVVEQKGAFRDGTLTLGGGEVPAEDTLWILLNEQGTIFCKKFQHRE